LLHPDRRRHRGLSQRRGVVLLYRPGQRSNPFVIGSRIAIGRFFWQAGAKTVCQEDILLAFISRRAPSTPKKAHSDATCCGSQK
jgi:hypothetical protein